MERVNDGKIWWKKKGGGSFMFNRQLIRPNMKFRAAPNEIPLAFRDLVVPLEDYVDPETAPDPLKTAPVVNYFIQPKGKSKFLFDVVDGSGKAINEKGLTKEIAENLLNDLVG
jgi:hypothetical protein